MPSRNTRRKKLIRALLDSTYPDYALLDELRWAVRASEFNRDPDGCSTVTRSWLNSFARTVREQFPEHTIQKIPLNGDTPIGLAARAAVYRLKDVNALQGFLHAKAPCILCRYRTDMEVSEPRYVLRYVTPQYHALTFRFFDGRPAHLTHEEIMQISGTLIPITQKLSVIHSTGVEADVQSLAHVPWKLFGQNALNDWFDVDPLSGLACVERNALR